LLCISPPGINITFDVVAMNSNFQKSIDVIEALLTAIRVDSGTIVLRSLKCEEKILQFSFIGWELTISTELAKIGLTEPQSI
jgi:hypothetical protein